MCTWKRFAGIVAALLIAAGVSHRAQAEPLRIGYLTWVGNGPYFVAKEKGFFAKEGIQVDLIDMAVTWRFMRPAMPGCSLGRSTQSGPQSTTCCLAMTQRIPTCA